MVLQLEVAELTVPDCYMSYLTTTLLDNVDK